MSSTEFQAVDLDAVLDAFESSQDLLQVVDDNNDQIINSTKDQENSSLPLDQQAILKPNLLEDLNRDLSLKDETLEVQQAIKETGISNRETLETVQVAEEPCRPQPDVVSGLENFSDNVSQHLEEHFADAEQHETTTSTTENKDNNSSDETSKSSEFESIYDKFKDKSDEEVEEPPIDPVPFQPAEISNDELNDMLDDLDEGAVSLAMIDDNQVNQTLANNSSEQLGARPKEFSTNNEVPDIVMDHESTVPRDSPPPYSEIDPMKTQQAPALERPNSLDISTNEDQGGGGEEGEDEVPNMNAEISEGGPPGSTPANPNGPSEAGIPESLQGLTEDQLMLGKIAPFWIPDTEASNCMICDSKFTLVRRRHHCRACGQVLCSLCCSEKFSLDHMEGKEGRVCKPCKTILERLSKAEEVENIRVNTSTSEHSEGNENYPRPNPANPMEYCSTIPPHQQVAASGGATATPPSVMVPKGVLKPSDASNSGSSDPKSRGHDEVHNESEFDTYDEENTIDVMFSDGIRPGGDLTELDGSPERRKSRRSRSNGHKKSRSSKHHVSHGPVGGSDIAKCLIPYNAMPHISGEGPIEDAVIVKRLMDGECLSFLINKNLKVLVKQLHYAPVSDYVWNFRTWGMTAVGQDEVVILLVKEPDEDLPPKDIFLHLQSLYEQAGRGGHVGDMGHTIIEVGDQFLGSTDFGGFLYFRHSFQCIDDLNLPEEPYLFAVLVTRWELPWARVFPLRLLLRLGAESRYYPTPLWSWKDRTTVYKEIGQTIMQVLCDFRNYTYAIPIINGMVIHMEDKLTTVLIPQRSYPQIQKALQMSNTPVLALGGNFSPTADSHLVAVQRDEDEPSKNPMNNSDYETQAINIQNKARKVTGASFIVLSGALKKSSGLTAKSSIVDDGIMVQISQDRMASIRKSLNSMENLKIDCGPLGSETPDETVYIKWVDAHQSVNAGIKSHIDDMAMDGIVSIRMSAGGTDFISGRNLIRWTEVFLMPSKNPEQRPGGVQDGGDDPARAAGHLARAICTALTPNLAKLKNDDLTPLAVRINLDPENSGYEAGSKGQSLPPEYMLTLDEELVPIICHGQTTPHSAFEFVFHILDV